MSSHQHNTTEALSPYTRDGPGGETPTFSRQKQFARRLRGVLSRINARIREAIIEDDLFGLQSEALVDDIPEDVFDFPTDRAKVRGFLQWLREQLDSDFLTVVGPDRNQFLRAAYVAGIRNIHQQLSDLDVGFARPDMDDLVSRPVHSSALQELYTRAYENLTDLRDDVAQEIREQLTEGFAEGKNPTDIARSVTNRVDSVGKHRATMIARTETIHAYTTGSVSRMEELNQNADFEVAGSHGEFDAAMGQERTCDFCRRLNGTPLKPSELSNGVVQFRGDVYRLGPPSHINGRCNVGVRVGGRITEPLSERLPAEITLVSGG